MNDSILTSVKKMLGIPEEHTAFDLDIITHINTVFDILFQLGAGPKDGFMIEDKSAQWSDYNTDIKMNMLKTYMFAKVRMMFDPPTSGAVTEAMNNVISEMEARISYYVDPEDCVFDEEEDDE